MKQNVAVILLQEATRPEMQWITITDCVMSRDLKHAKLYFTTIERNLAHEEALKILEEEKKAVRHRLAKRIILKYMPELRFVWDDTVLIDEKIREIHDERR
ncbi:30S ribosome-binding factor RbfA [candidate division WOR-3 bacterium]|nr:30S ribosome-binding factor RbfA [candidate division WOR-3 bacterium]